MYVSTKGSDTGVTDLDCKVDVCSGIILLFDNDNNNYISNNNNNINNNNNNINNNNNNDNNNLKN